MLVFTNALKYNKDPMCNVRIEALKLEKIFITTHGAISEHEDNMDDPRTPTLSVVPAPTFQIESTMCVYDDLPVIPELLSFPSHGTIPREQQGHGMDPNEEFVNKIEHNKRSRDSATLEHNHFAKKQRNNH
jgi:hypothetical protein